MRRYGEEELRSTRRSHQFYLPPDEVSLQQRMDKAITFEGLYTHILYQDLQQVMPYRSGSNQIREVKVVGRDAARASELIAEALSERFHPMLYDGVRDFVSTTAQYIVLGGEVTYEIAYVSSSSSAPDAEPEGFRLERIHPGSLAERDRLPIQYVPKAISPLIDRDDLHYVVLDPATLVRFALPDDLLKPVSRLVSFLNVASSEQLREYALVQQAMESGLPYSFQQHRRLLAELFGEVSEPVGWNARDLFKEGQLEPYGVWRQIRFLEFKVRLRSKILAQLNEALKIAGERMEFQAALEIDGLATLETVETLKAEFREGSKGFNELVDSAWN